MNSDGGAQTNAENVICSSRIVHFLPNVIITRDSLVRVAITTHRPQAILSLPPGTSGTCLTDQPPTRHEVIRKVGRAEHCLPILRLFPCSISVV